MITRGRAAALLAILLALGVAAAAANAHRAHHVTTFAPAPQLVPSSADLVTLGLHPVRASASAARARLGDAVADRELTAIGTAAGTGRGERLEFDAFELRSAGDGGRELSTWRRAHHASTVKLKGGAAAFTIGSRRRRTAEVLIRDRGRLGLVVLALSRRASSAAKDAIGFAQLEESHLSTAVPPTAWGRVLAQVRPNGSVTETTALEAVALAYGPLPGVRVPAGARVRVPSGTGVGAWVLGYLPRLKPRLRRAVYRDLGLAPPGSHAHAASFGDPGFHQSASLTTAANTWASVYADGGHLAHHLSLTIVAGTTTSPLDGADADSYPENAAGDYSPTGPYCVIRVAPSVASGSISYLTVVLAHEVFHCFEFDLDHNWKSVGAWVIEGMAEWAALSVDHVMTPTAESWLSEYVNTPETALFSRTYDAIGFWGHSEDTVGSLWPKVAEILNAPSDEARFADAGGTTTGFLNTWGSSTFRIPTGGLPWQMQSPEPLPLSYAGGSISALEMGAAYAKVEAAPYTTAQYVVEANPLAPIVLVSISGSARLDYHHNYTDLGGAWFCTTDETGCRCPPDTTGEVPPTRPLRTQATLGVAGDPGTGTDGTLTAYTLAAFCKPNTPPPSKSGQAATGGDPHLVDFDGAMFNFQAAGEFTLLKSTTDNLQIQIRQQPFPHSRSVAVNTAIAVQDGRAIVEIDSGKPSSVSALVNHHKVHAAETHLAGGGLLTLNHTSDKLPPGTTPASICGKAHEPAKYLKLCEQLVGALATGSTSAAIRWPDGSTVDVFNGVTSDNAKTWVPALSIEIQVARHRLKHLTGLLGNADVAYSDEFRGRTGKHFNATDIVEGDIGTAKQAHVLYGEFGASWRITQKQSLFTYKRGKSTRSYTIRNFPTQAFNTSHAPTTKQQQAAAICQAAGVTNTTVARDCEYDVLATGNDGFAGGDGPLQTVENTYNPPPKTPPLHPIALGTGDDAPRIAYDPAHGDTYVVWEDNADNSIDVCTLTVAAPDCNGGAGSYKLVDQLALAGGASPTYFSPQVLVQPGGTVVVLAEAYGTSAAANPPGYSNIGAIAWSSAAGGGAFASGDQGSDDGGMLLASTIGTGDAPGNGAIALTPTDIGIYGNEYPFGSGFADFSLGAPAGSTTPVPDSTGDYGSQIEVDGNQLAAIPDPAIPGEYIVVAVGADYGDPSGCPSGTQEATGYGVGIGTPSELQTQTAWGTSYFKPVSCDAFAPALAGGGPSGGTIGLLEDEGPGLSGSGSDGVYYRIFSTLTGSFGPAIPVSDETQETLDGADELSVSQDSAGGVYGAWLDGRGWTLDYSDSGGTSWPAARPTGLTSGGDVTVQGVGNGDAWLAYNNDGEEYVVPLAFNQLATP